jgi:oxygen-dependent protoporphyrinogen oxidase
MTRDSVLVVGGGITGLAAARSLALDGIPVALAEAGSRLGGKVSTERVDGFVIESGPDSILATRPAGIALARELGLGEELVGTRGMRRVYVRHRGRLVPIPEGLGLVLPTRALPFARTRLFSAPEKVRMTKDLVWPRTLGPEDVAVGTFLRARLGSPLVDRLAGPLVGGVYGTPIDELSLDAVVPQLRVAERDHRSLLLAGLADGRTMRSAAAARPPGEPALGTFASLRDGMGSLVTALAESLAASGVQVQSGRPVLALERAGTGVAARFADGSLGRFGAVVLATPAPVAARLLADGAPDAATALATIPHGSSIVIALGYPRTGIGRELDGHGYLVPAGEGGAISAATWASEKWPGRAPDDMVLVRLSVRDEPPWTTADDAILIAAARDDVERTLRISAEPVLARLTRWTGSMPRYTVGHLGRVATIDAAMAAWPAAALAGSSYLGVGLPDCVAQGQAAASRVRAWLGSSPASADAEAVALAG